MRGSPIIRFLLLTCALSITAFGLVRVTAKNVKKPEPAQTTEKLVRSSSLVPFRLILSSRASLVEIDTGKLLRPVLTEGPVTGELEIDPHHPRLGIIVKWSQPSTVGEHRFAKITLEAPGMATFSHTFDAAGDLDEFIELPFPTAP